jgi:lipoprotein-anchoring transpeptidase ErfK/SrfK
MRKEFEMARILVPRGRRSDRNRIYTIVSLVIAVAIIAYLFILFRGSHPDTSNTGLITNSNGTTVHSELENALGAGQTNIGDASVQNSSPGRTSQINSDTATASLSRAGTPKPEKITPTTSGTGGVPVAVQTPALPVSTEAENLIAEATSLLSQGTTRIIEARDKFNEALRSRTISQQQAKFVKDKLSSLADDWLFNRIALPGDRLCEQYKVQSGDQLRIIGEKGKVPYEILMELNKITDPTKLRAGQIIKVVNGPFNVKIYRSTFTMDVYLQNTYVRTFIVGLGVVGKETPTGLWKVKPGGKLIEPEWTDPSGHTYYPSDPDYPLGSRWIALEGVSGNAVGKKGFAIHGTHKPEQLGTAGSQGCIRLENGNAILVYNMLIPAYSTVEVMD